MWMVLGAKRHRLVRRVANRLQTLCDVGWLIEEQKLPLLVDISTKRPQRFSITATCSRRLLVSHPSLLSLVTSGQRLCSTSRDAPSLSSLACLFPLLLDRSPLPSRSISISHHSNFNSTGERHDEMDDANTRSRSEWRPKVWGDPSRRR